MPIALSSDIVILYDLNNEDTWADLVSFLKPYVRHFVYSAHVASWLGQEEDITEDVAQESVCRTFERYQRAECGEALPINSLERMAIRIAHNYLIDMLRRDRRLQRFSSDPSSFEDAPQQDNQMNPFEMAIEYASQAELFVWLAHEIVHFPEKRRKSLLIDLANRMYFDTELTPLQETFLAEGIDFQEYQQTLPPDAVERAKHTALVSLGYKQVTIVMREYALDN